MSKKPTKEQEAAVRAVKRRCRGPLPKEAQVEIKKLLAEGKEAEARALDRRSRQRCGSDFNDVILSNPLDGQSRSYTCLQCGVPGRYTAPLFG